MEALKDYRKNELLNGVVYNMSPANIRHIRIQGHLHRIIGNFLQGKKCMVFSEAEVVFSEQNHLIPDINITCERSKVKDTYIDGAPDFVAEILSPSTRKRDMTVKKDIYEKFGVKEYWIISPKDEAIEVYRLNEHGVYYLENIYTNFSENEWARLTAEERAEQKLSLKVSLYDDLEIQLKDIFAD